MGEWSKRWKLWDTGILQTGFIRKNMIEPGCWKMIYQQVASCRQRRWFVGETETCDRHSDGFAIRISLRFPIKFHSLMCQPQPKSTIEKCWPMCHILYIPAPMFIAHYCDIWKWMRDANNQDNYKGFTKGLELKLATRIIQKRCKGFWVFIMIR